MKENILKENLNKALGLFIEAMRQYIPAIMMKEHGKLWDEAYFEGLTDNQKSLWSQHTQEGEKSPQMMIDFGNLGGFAIKQKRLLRDDFGRDSNNLPTYFNQIGEARHMLAHYDDWDNLKAETAFNQMLIIAKKLKMKELEDEISSLKKTKEAALKTKVTNKNQPNLTAWFNNVKPHLDIRQGNLDESVFAADLGEVALGKGREVYQNHSLFFAKTFFSNGLKNIAKKVISGLNGDADASNRAITLQTEFGGGKTHSLITMYHIAKGGKRLLDFPSLSGVFDVIGKPKFEQVNVAVFTNTTNNPANGRMVDGLQIKTLWGDLAYQLGGKEAYDIIANNDQNMVAPGGDFRKVLEHVGPSLILIDELADYCVKANPISLNDGTYTDQIISFVQDITEAISRTPNCVLIVTLPSSHQVAASPLGQEIYQKLTARAKRVTADTTPVEKEEIFEVIRRRLFEELGDSTVTESVVSSYAALYQEIWTELPSHAPKGDYKEQMMRAYPFHPELINIFRNRWASHPDFQRTRGVLRLLASIVADLWKRKNNLTGINTLIHSSHVNLANLDTVTGEVRKLFGNGYDAVITSDVSGISSNASMIDEEKPDYGQYTLTKNISATIFLSSFGSQGVNKGITIKNIKLHVMVPGSFNHNSINGSLDELQNRAYYLYYTPSGGSEQKFWYHTKPNLNILVNKSKAEIKESKIESHILNLLQEQTSRVTKFKIAVNPTASIPEQHEPALIILPPSIYANGNKKLAKTIEELATKKGNGERIFRNTILFLYASSQGRSKLYAETREYLACLKIKEDYSTQLEKDQLNDLRSRIEESKKQVSREVVTAYNHVSKHRAKDGLATIKIKQFSDRIDQQIATNIFDELKKEEWLLSTIGVNLLRKNNLLPEAGKPVQLKSVYEAFLRYDDKPMVTNAESVSSSIKKYMFNGQFAIASKLENGWSKMFMGETMSSFEKDDDTLYLVTPAEYNSWKEGLSAPTSGTSATGGNGATSSSGGTGGVQEPEPGNPILEPAAEILKSISISGTVNATVFNELFKSLVYPLKDNKVSIEIKVTGYSTNNAPITEQSQQYKITKESASQLGLKFEEGE
jgi:predicted AAA+ superfamily ATPase